MKWKDLSLKERKQIYDSVRVNNPGATYFDIKEQFDSIPAYEDGGKSIVDEVNKVENVDKTYGTNYKRAYSNIAYKDTTKRGSYVKWGDTDKDGYGQINIKNILEYMRNPTSNKMVKNQYDLYRNKNEYIDRLNKLIPMEILMPLGGAGFVGHELNKE